MTQNNTFSLGYHRPVYLWGGPGTIRMNQLKFMNAPVDEQVHHECHTSVGAQRMLEAGFNWAYLMYNWGFPPEVEKVDWEDFAKAVKIYQQAGIKTFGYVQTSNCAYAGSFKDKDWYTLDPRGRHIYYYTGRYMTCWLHPEWISQLKEIISGIVEAGSDGVFFDNPWMGGQPVHFGGTWSGPAGCYCERCQNAFHEASGLEIPTQIDPRDDKTSRQYLTWRADIVTQTIQNLSDHARAINHGVVISANDYDAVMQPSYITHGIDLRALSLVQDMIMIEDFCLPRWEPGDTPELVNNAITIRTALALLGDTPLSVDPYDEGIGFDDVYPPRRLQQGICEAAACGVPMVVKGTEYVDEKGVFTLLTAEKYAPQREAVKEIHQWLAENAALYEERKNEARVGLLYPEEGIRFQWNKLAPLYFGVAQTLTNAKIPWQVVTANDDWSGLEAIFTFEETETPQMAIRTIHVPDLPSWNFPADTFLAKNRAILYAVFGVLSWYYRAYFRYRWARALTDGLGITQWFLQSPHFRLPSESAQQTVLDKIDDLTMGFQISSPAPLLMETWRKGETLQIHLVNYAQELQSVSLDFTKSVKGRVLTPNQDSREFQAESLQIEVDVYSIILI